MKKLGILLLSLITAMLVVGFAYAAEPGGATVSGLTDNGEFNGPAAGNVSVEAGNITTLNLDTNQSTFRWVGLLGDVSGNIVLGDNNNVSLYTWVAEGNLVYASAGAVDWSLLNDGTEAEIVAIDTFVDGNASDNYTNTFTGASESIGSNIFSISSDYANTTSLGGNDWKTYSLEDGTFSVYAGKVDATNLDYTGAAADYQMIIPEDGTSGNTLATTYNLWVELI